MRVSLTGNLLSDPPFFVPDIDVAPLEKTFYSGANSKSDIAKRAIFAKYFTENQTVVAF